MILSNLIPRLGLGLLFVWAGLEKFFEGFLGGVGLERMAAGLGKRGFDFLGENGLFVLAFVLALTELVVGILILLNKKVRWAGFIAAFIMLVALLTSYITKSWMQSMIHIALLASYLGIALAEDESREFSSEG